MRILRVAQKIYPDVKGGGPYHVHAMSRDQAAMGHEVTVLTLDPKGDKLHIEERDGYTVIRYPVTMNALGNDVSAGVASYLQDADDFDVIHAHSHLYFSTNLAALKRALGGPPLAITNHGLYSQNAPEWLFDFYLRSIGKWTFNQADVVFCYTEEDRRRVRNFGVNSDIKVVPNGVDTEKFTPEGGVSKMINHDGLVVLFVGRLVEGKRPEDAIDAVSCLPKKLNAKLYVVGDGPLRSELETKVNSHIVEFLGQVPYEDMPAVCRAGNVLLLPSRAEGLPRTVLEAMATGTPVVVTDLEQVAPVISGAGKTVSLGDIDGFAEGVRQVLTSPEQYDPRSNASKFSWSNTVQRTTDSLLSLVNETANVSGE